MLLIGMTGPIGHGKSTFAAALTQLEPNSEHLESSMVIADVANAMQASPVALPQSNNLDSVNQWLHSLPAILLQVVHPHCTFDQIKIDQEQLDQHPVEYEKLLLHIDNLNHNPALAKAVITKENKESYRPLLQWLGGYLVQKVDPGIWYKEIIRRAYSAETRGCKLCMVGGLRFPADAALIRQAGGFIIKVYRPGHLQNDVLDPTERERDNIKVDTTVVSNGTVEDLNKCAAVVYQDAQNNELRSVYETADFASQSASQP